MNNAIINNINNSMRKGKFKAAVAQMTSIHSKEENFDTCRRLAEKAKEEGCSLVCFPENHSYIGFGRKGEIQSIAEPLTGSTIQKYCNLATTLSMWLSLGGFQEQTTPPSEKVYNSHVIINPEGIIHSVYRKIHLFDINIEGGPSFTESANIQSGNEVVVADTELGRLGLAICYDIRFPELFQQLRFKYKSDIIMIPAAFTKPTGEAHWELLVRTRAVENQCYVLAAAQAGRHNEKRESFGCSLIVDPWGTVVARLDDINEVGIAVAEIDFEKLQSVRSGIPLENHKRKDIFQLYNNNNNNCNL